MSDLIKPMSEEDILKDKLKQMQFNQIFLKKLLKWLPPHLNRQIKRAYKQALKETEEK